MHPSQDNILTQIVGSIAATQYLIKILFVDNGNLIVMPQHGFCDISIVVVRSVNTKKCNFSKQIPLLLPTI